MEPQPLRHRRADNGARRQMTTKKNIHVVPHRSGWVTRRESSARSSGVYATQHEAIRHARRLAMQDHTELVIHNRDGRIQEASSYDSSPGKRTVKPAPVASRVNVTRIKRAVKKQRAGR
jgi:hypothetical protein